MMTEFEDQNDKNRVVRDGPWNFDKCLILVKGFEGGQQVKNICLEEASFWIWVHDLPLMMCNEYIGRKVSVSICKVQEVDLEYREVKWGEFMQIRVSMDITKPLVHRKWLNLGVIRPV